MSTTTNRREFFWLELVTVAAYVWYVWTVTCDQESAGVRFYGAMANGCYRVARRVGRIGMRAEQAAYAAMERRRL